MIKKELINKAIHLNQKTNITNWNLFWFCLFVPILFLPIFPFFFFPRYFDYLSLVRNQREYENKKNEQVKHKCCQKNRNKYPENFGNRAFAALSFSTAD